MISGDNVIASLSDAQLTLAQLLQGLHRQGRLAPIIHEALGAQLVTAEARKAGLSVTTEELQAAADGFRRRNGLVMAAATQDWLTARKLSVEEFEAGLELILLAGKLREHLTASRIEGHFATRRTEYDRLGFALLRASREDLARELASQIQEEGRDLATLAAEQGLRLSQLVKSRQELRAPLRKALESAKVGQLVGPVATPDGFLLVLVEEIIPGELDTATRHQLQEELFGEWLSAQLQKATINLPIEAKH